MKQASFRTECSTVYKVERFTTDAVPAVLDARRKKRAMLDARNEKLRTKQDTSNVGEEAIVG